MRGVRYPLIFGRGRGEIGYIAPGWPQEGGEGQCPRPFSDRRKPGQNRRGAALSRCAYPFTEKPFEHLARAHSRLPNARAFDGKPDRAAVARHAAALALVADAVRCGSVLVVVWVAAPSYRHHVV